MKYRIFYLAILLFLFSMEGVAQTKPEWIRAIEKTIAEKETAWKVKSTNERINGKFFHEGMILASGKSTASIEITVWGEIQNPKETFDSLVTIFDKSEMGRATRKVEFGNFGDQGFIWTAKRGGYAFIKFRKKDIFVYVFAPSEKIARRWAQYVIDEMP